MQSKYLLAMATSTMESPDFRNQHHAISNKHISANSQCLSIDGPGSKLTSALQVVTEALSSTENVSNQSSSIQINQAPPSQVQECPKTMLISQPTNLSSQSTSFDRPSLDVANYASNSTSSSSFSSLDSIQTNNASDMIPSSYDSHQKTSANGKTIISPDSDVSNGFVKDGKMLPYVFEANEAGRFFGNNF